MTAEPHHSVDEALERLADGTDLDWDDLERDAVDADERDCLRWLRVLDQIADVHVSTSGPDDTMGGTPLVRPSRAAIGTWGKYELLEQVGAGSFGSVYRARDPELDFELALKILHQKTSDARLTRALIDEGRALARIRHPNVVRVLRVESDGDRVGLCMDFVRGHTLEDLLTVQGPFSAAEAVLIGMDLCGALAAVHRAGFIHRDVKARNVIREQGGRHVLMDFGAGRTTTPDAARRGDMMGTPLYMAPEVLAGAPASASSDVYAVGVLLYRLVTGEYPVPAGTVDELRAAHRSGRRQFLSERRPDLPIPFVTVVERMLSTEREKRFATAGAASDALALVLRNETDKKERVADALSKFFKATYVVVGSAALTTALGAMSSRMFNFALGLEGFVTETPRDWLVWGARSLVLPVLTVLVALVAASHFVVLQRFVTSRLVVVAHASERLRRVAHDYAYRLRLTDAAMLAGSVLVLSSCGLIAALWYFYPLFVACLEPISEAPAEQLALLAPPIGTMSYQLQYRWAFTVVVLMASAGWFTAWKLSSSQGRTPSRLTQFSGLAVIALAMAFLSLPYRVMRHVDFERVSWNDEPCYALGERERDVLLFCPRLQPRKRIVSKTPDVTRSGRVESIFTIFGERASHAVPR